MEKTGVASSASKVQVGVGTIFGASGPARFERPHSMPVWLRLLRATALLLVVIISLVWLFSLLKTRLSVSLIPWFLVFWLAFVCGVLAICKGKGHGEAYGGGHGGAMPLRLIQFQEPNYLQHWLAFSYLSASVLVFFLLAKLPSHWLAKPIVTRQVVDIQLTSLTDYADHHDILPSTKPRPLLSKRSAAAHEVVTNPTTNQGVRAAAISKKAILTRPIRQHSSDRYSSDHHSIGLFKRASDPTFFIASEKPEEQARARSPVASSFPWPQYSANSQLREAAAPPIKTVTATKGAYTPSAIELNEVHPAPLLEVTDNEGDKGMELWQAGGRSNGGKGAPSWLSNYLKEMHKKLKKTWTPPSGSSCRVKVMFRLRREGTTAAVKLIASSGDAAVDQSALKAIASASPFGNLPSDYIPQYLDVIYTFNYRTDELTEVTAR